MPVQVQCRILDSWGWCTGTTQRDGMGREEGGVDSSQRALTRPPYAVAEELERLPVGCWSGCGQQGAVEPALSSPAQRQRRSPHFLPGSYAARNPEQLCGPRVWRCMPAASQRGPLAPDRRHLPLVQHQGFWAFKSTRYRVSPCGPQLVFSSVAQSCLTLCDPMGCNMPVFPVLQHLPEFAQTHVH